MKVLRSSFFVFILMHGIHDVTAQNDVVIGTDYEFNLQRKNNHGDAFILHNAEYASGDDVLSWTTTHSSFGMRGIRFSYSNGKGIYFYADDRASTSGSTFTPYTRFFIGNNGKVGVNTVAPQGALQINAIRPILMNYNGSQGVYGSEIGFNAMLNTGVVPNKFKKLGGTGQNGGAAIVVDYNGSMFFQMYNGGTESESIVDYKPQVAFSNTGNVGIGTSAPGFRLDVEGSGARIKNPHTSDNAYTTFRLQGPDYAQGLEIDFFGNDNITSDPNWSYGGGAGSAAIINVNAKPLVLGTNNQGKMLIDANGNVSIGTTDSKGYKLSVAGKTVAEEVVVKLQGNWPDYVFEGGYTLPALSELEEFIVRNQHLPDVPTANQVQQNGLSLGQMNAILLQKIEELTLHLIQQDKINTAQAERIDYLQMELKTLANKRREKRIK